MMMNWMRRTGLVLASAAIVGCVGAVTATEALDQHAFAGGSPASVASVSPGWTVDRPPAGAYHELVLFARCMRAHGVQMPNPSYWRGHDRLIVHLPPDNAHNHSAHVACNHLRLAAKHAGGVHCASAASAPARTEARTVTGSARAYVANLVACNKFSGAVLLAQNGHVILRAAFGWANRAGRIPNRPNTVFRIASLTKQFTAMGILRLRDEGRLNVDDHLCTYIAQCPTAWQAITLKQLLTHSSGIPDYESLRSYEQISRRHLTPGQLVDLVRLLPPRFAPGTRWSYSNSGYVLLGAVIERVSGEPYATFLQSQVLAPLGLRTTSYDANHPPLPAHATGYSSPSTPEAYIDMSVPYAAGALSSDIDDLYRWDQALISGRPQLVQPATLAQMFEPWVPIDASDPAVGAYGFGWFIDDHGAEYDHDGLINGFASYNAIFPTADAVVVVLSNLQSSDVRTIADHLAGLIGLHAF